MPFLTRYRSICQSSPGKYTHFDSFSVRSKEQRIADLTKDFYQILPHSFGMKRPPNIDHVLRVKEKIKMLESLNDIVVTEHALTSQMVSKSCNE